MTREEAIEILSRPKSMKGVPAKILTAHNMAIQALEQEPCEDAIKYFHIVNELSETLGVSYNFVNEKIREAIIAFKVLPQESCDDTISRQAAIKAICKHCTPEEPERCPTAEICHTYQELKALPPVNPTEKVGHWIKIDDCSNSGYYCSECRKRVIKEGWSDTVKIIKYCPNCGVKMQANPTGAEKET